MGSTVDCQYSVLRNSSRYPLHLEVILKTATDIQVESPVEFTIVLPVEALGTEQQVLVKCRGRVARRSEDASGRRVAVVIDYYEFVRPEADRRATSSFGDVRHSCS